MAEREACGSIFCDNALCMMETFLDQSDIWVNAAPSVSRIRGICAYAVLQLSPTQPSHGNMNKEVPHVAVKFNIEV